MTINEIYLGDCLEGMKKMVEQGIKVDLIVTDPPYDISNTNAGNNNDLCKSIQNAFDELEDNNLTSGITEEFLDLMVQLQDKINIYIWCNLKQVKFYLDYFIDKKGCTWDEIIWHKPNAMPCFNNKYLTDKEYCLYFRKGGKCMPKNYEQAKTVYSLPINVLDKKSYKHPTIKPLSIIKNLIENSSEEGQIVFDPFMGSGTTCVAAKELGRKYIGFEINEKYFNIAKDRLNGFDQNGNMDLFNITY